MSVINIIKDFIVNTKIKANDKKFALGIATTSFDFEQPFFSFPRAIEGWGYYLHVICPSSHHGDDVIDGLKGYIDEFFLDVEDKKIEFNHVEIRNRNADISFISLYPNEITVRACFDLINNLNGVCALIFGHGDLAFRFASLMSQRNLNFYWTASRKSKSEKYLKMAKEFSAEECDSVDSQTDILFNFSSQSSKFLTDAAEHTHFKIVDVASKGAFGAAFKDRVHSIDISARLVNEISFSVKGNIYNHNYGRITTKSGVSFVSGGYLGDSGDLVVDNYRAPSFLIGISNGSGGFSKRINKVFNES